MTDKEMAERIRRIEARLFGSDYVANTDSEFKADEPQPKEPEKKEAK